MGGKGNRSRRVPLKSASIFHKQHALIIYEVCRLELHSYEDFTSAIANNIREIHKRAYPFAFFMSFRGFRAPIVSHLTAKFSAIGLMIAFVQMPALTALRTKDRTAHHQACPNASPNPRLDN
jgi:hypothetical protein